MANGVIDAPPGVWHVHFNGELRIEGHVCELHRALGLALPACGDSQDAEGNCAHVQLRRCTHAPVPPCSACVFDLAELPA